MITITSKGDFKKADSYLEKLLEVFNHGSLDKYGQLGVEALRSAIPRDTGETADSWSYEIQRQNGQTKIIWSNDHTNQNVNIAVILQYGHGLHGGGYVEGIDYINPAMRPIFDDIAENAWKEVTSL